MVLKSISGILKILKEIAYLLKPVLNLVLCRNLPLFIRYNSSSPDSGNQLDYISSDNLYLVKLLDNVSRLTVGYQVPL